MKACNKHEWVEDRRQMLKCNDGVNRMYSHFTCTVCRRTKAEPTPMRTRVYTDGEQSITIKSW